MGDVIAFNTTQHSIVRDAEGHVIEPQSFDVVDDEVAAEQLEGGALRVINPEVIEEGQSSQAAILVKQKFKRVKDANDNGPKKPDESNAPKPKMKRR